MICLMLGDVSIDLPSLSLPPRFRDWTCLEVSGVYAMDQLGLLVLAGPFRLLVNPWLALNDIRFQKLDQGDYHWVGVPWKCSPA